MADAIAEMLPLIVEIYVLILLIGLLMKMNQLLFRN